MAFRFRANQNVLENLRRIAAEEIEAALAEIADPELDTATVVHQVRKRTKKVRGLLRLVRSGMPTVAGNENTIFRDAASELSSARDTDVALATLDAFKPKLRKRLSKDAFAQLRRAVKRHQPPAAGQGSDAETDTPVDEKLQAFAEVMQLARQRIDDWSFESDAKASEGKAKSQTASPVEFAIDGVTTSYRKSRRRMKQAKAALRDKDVSAEDRSTTFHDWRKRVKDYGYHLRLLRDVAPDRMKESSQLASQLGEVLGDDHDLTILANIVRGLSHETISAADADAVLSVLEQQSRKLREQALELGSQLFAESSRDFREKITDAWNDWQA